MKITLSPEIAKQFALCFLEDAKRIAADRKREEKEKKDTQIKHA